MFFHFSRLRSSYHFFVLFLFHSFSPLGSHAWRASALRTHTHYQCSFGIVIARASLVSSPLAHLLPAAANITAVILLFFFFSDSRHELKIIIEETRWHHTQKSIQQQIKKRLLAGLMAIKVKKKTMKEWTGDGWMFGMHLLLTHSLAFAWCCVQMPCICILCTENSCYFCSLLVATSICFSRAYTLRV